MSKKKTEAVTEDRDEELFRSLQKKKKRRKRRAWTIAVVIVLLLAVGGTLGVQYLKHKVTTTYASTDDDISSYEATVGTVSTTVSGSGTLSNVDEETVTVPAGVEIEEMLVESGSTVSEGDALATVRIASVLTALSDVQDELDTLDSSISDASDDTVSSSVVPNIAGRVKAIYAEAGDEVSAVMAEHGALALISLDGYMSARIRTDALSAGDSVTVVRADGKEISGTVESVTAGIATVLVTDNGPALDEVVTVIDSEGVTLGTAALKIHRSLSVTGITGTVSRVNVSLNSRVYASTSLFTLKNTSYTAAYDTLLRQRGELEDTLSELLAIYRSGTVTAPFSGSVTAVSYDEDSTDTTSEYALVTLSPDRSMSISISVDESDILSLEVGQTAIVSVNSISDESFPGTISEISTTATSSSGVTRYSATVTLDKDSRMLSGMSASVTVNITGVDNAVLIPVDALQQTSTTYYVYTSYDSESGELGGVREVVPGISNSSYVEISSGLSEGETVYYKASSANMFGFSFGGSDSADMSGFSGGGDMSGFSGGDMSGFTGGGDMPSGGGHSGGSGFSGGGMPSGGPGGNG